MMPRPRPDWGRDLALPRPVALRWLMPTAVALLTFGALLPTLRNGFVTWDDIHLFVNNPHYRGLGWQEIHWMWTTSLLGAYRPVTWMTYGLDYLLWGLDPFGYHLTNLVLHTAAALAVYVLGLQLFRLAGAAPDEGQGRAAYGAAALGALAFGLHPLRAEPVAWVAARGTILGGLLLFLSTMLYLRGAAEARLGRIRTGWLLCAAGVFALALLSRAAGIVLPAVLVVLDVYPLRRLGGGRGRWLGPAARHVWWEKVPFVVLGAATIPFLVRARMGSAWRSLPSPAIRCSERR